MRNRRQPTLLEREKRLNIPAPSAADRTRRVGMERALLSSMLLAGDAILIAKERGIAKDHFYDIRHQIILDAIYDLSNDPFAPVDLVTVDDAIRDQGKAQECPIEYLVSVFDDRPSAANAKYYADRLVHFYQVRRREADAVEALRKLRQGDDISVAEARSLLQEAASSAAPDNVLLPKKLQIEILKKVLEEEANGIIRGTPTGWPSVDRMLGGGVIPSNLYIVAGRTSEGKSAAACQIALNVGLEGRAVHYFSLELSHTDMSRRMSGALGRRAVPQGRMQFLSPAARAEFGRAVDAFGDLPINVDDRQLTLDQIEAECRRLKGHVDLFVIDHARLVRVPEADGEYESVRATSAACKRIAVSCNAAVILVCQVNRAGGREETPKMDRLQSSGTLEQDADVVLLVVKKWYGRKDEAPPDPEKANEAKFSVQKNRITGSVEDVKMQWFPKQLRFEEIANGY